MPLAIVKEEFQNKKISFGKSGLPLGQRDDIDELAIIALESNDKSLLNLFEKLPPLAELKKKKVDEQLRKSVAAIKSTHEKLT
jgi:hypothetical protein